MNTKSNNIEAPFQLLKTYISNLALTNNCLDNDPDAEGTRTIDVGYQILKIDKSTTGDFISLLALSVNIETKTISGDFSLNAVIQGVFSGDGSQLDEEDFTKLLKINGCSALYSILRGAIINISSQAFSSGNVIIPMVNFIRFHELDNESHK